MILPFTFNEEAHLYQTEGRYCLSTSDVIDLNGIGLLDPRIPIATLRAACFRGKCLHKAVERYELGDDWQKDLPEEFITSMDGWFAFRDQCDIRVVGKPETRYVYLQGECENAIGGTIDLRFIHGGDLWICDLKTIYPLSGKALKQKQLAWRLQTESYRTATEFDEAFLTAAGEFREIKRCIVHIHPVLKNGFAFHKFPEDDSAFWDAAVCVAMRKLAAGIEPTKRDLRTVHEMLEMSNA